MVALAMDVDKQRPYLRQDAHRGRTAVQSRIAATAGLDLTTQDQQTIAVVDLQFFENVRESVPLRDALEIKSGINRRRSRPGTHHVRADPVSEDRTQGVDQDRLAGPGLAGEDVEPRAKGNLEGFDDGEIANGELNEHWQRMVGYCAKDRPASRTLPEYAL